MGLEVQLILEVRQRTSKVWQGFYPASLGVRENLTRDYDFLKALALYPDKIESHPVEVTRGLPRDVSVLVLQCCCHVMFRQGGVWADVDAPDEIESEGDSYVVTRGGVRFSYSTRGFCRNHTWLTYHEVIRALKHYDLAIESLAAGYCKLLQRAKAFELCGFETRFVGWVCN